VTIEAKHNNATIKGNQEWLEQVLDTADLYPSNAVVEVMSTSRWLAAEVQVIFRSKGIRTVFSETEAKQFGHVVALGGAIPHVPDPPAAKAVLIILGNRPYDEYTASIDLVKRAEFAASQYHQLAEYQDVVVIPTGSTVSYAAPTAMPESRMMALVCAAHGVPWDRIIEEPNARSTWLNAALSLELLQQTDWYSHATDVYVVSKETQMKYALRIFRKMFRKGRFLDHPVLPLQFPFPDEACIEDMEWHLKNVGTGRWSDDLQDRIGYLRQGQHGID
jgi:hypothetical protein